MTAQHNEHNDYDARGRTAVDLLLNPALQAGHPDLVERVLRVAAACQHAVITTWRRISCVTCCV
jgi:hypothetical protein